MEQLYEIMPCGTKAKECNPLGSKPRRDSSFYGSDHNGRDLFNYQLAGWEEEERNRKEYEIEPQPCKCALEYGKCPTPTHCFWEVGTIHSGIIVNNKIKIV